MGTLRWKGSPGENLPPGAGERQARVVEMEGQGSLQSSSEDHINEMWQGRMWRGDEGTQQQEGRFKQDGESSVWDGRM